MAKTGKPLLISTGMASLAELEQAVRTIRGAGCENFVLLKCTSTYPASPENTNVRTIPHMSELFRCQVGFSDHTMGVGAAVAAAAMGATVIEKHFTLRRADGGPDSAFSLEPEELKALVVETERAWQAMGEVQYGPIQAEVKSLQFRRSLYVSKSMRSGDSITSETIKAVRPGYGLPTKYFDDVIGKVVKQDVAAGTPLHWDLFE